jgi:hypothetical protein
MAFPAEFKYENEDDFIRRLLVPLLHRLGYSMVVPYHGSSELGKDLVFGEIDRFGHVRYHGLQAKYEPSISLNGSGELIEDCRQAFANPFKHPQTGAVESISSFYAVNGGSLGSDAIAHYFNSLRPQFYGNVQLLQGKDLVILDRWASVNRVNSIGEQITGLLLELRYNETIMSFVRKAISEDLNSVEQLRVEAVSAYLSRPFLARLVNAGPFQEYYHFCSFCNRLLQYAATPLGVGKQKRVEIRDNILNNHFPVIEKYAQEIEAALKKTLALLGPLTSI